MTRRTTPRGLLYKARGAVLGGQEKCQGLSADLCACDAAFRVLRGDGVVGRALIWRTGFGLVEPPSKSQVTRWNARPSVRRLSASVPPVAWREAVPVGCGPRPVLLRRRRDDLDGIEVIHVDAAVHIDGDALRSLESRSD